jgi:predicted NACHT family NTPase
MLDEAGAWAERNTPSALEMAFLEAGRAAREREAAEERVQQARELELAQQAALALANRRAANRLRYFAGILVMFLAATAGLAALALNNAAKANAEHTLALSRQLAAQSIIHLEDQPDLALLLSVEANRLKPTEVARESLLEGLEHAANLMTYLHGHKADVNNVAFSPNGTMLASGSDDHTIRLWDVANGRQLGPPLTGHTDFVTSVVFSPDGTMLASGSDDKTIRLWDVASGRPLRTLTGHTGTVRSVAFSPNGTMLASGSDDKTIGLWDVASGRLLRALRGHTDFVNVVEPVLKVLCHGLLDKGYHTIRDVRRHLSQAPRLSIETGIHYSPQTVTLKRQSAGQHLVQHDADRVQV